MLCESLLNASWFYIVFYDTKRTSVEPLCRSSALRWWPRCREGGFGEWSLGILVSWSFRITPYLCMLFVTDFSDFMFLYSACCFDAVNKAKCCWRSPFLCSAMLFWHCFLVFVHLYLRRCVNYAVFYTTFITSVGRSRRTTFPLWSQVRPRWLSYEHLGAHWRALEALLRACCLSLDCLLRPSWCPLAPKSKIGVSPRRDATFY